MWKIIQRYNLKQYANVTDKFIFASNFKWICELYRWWNYTCGAEPIWKASFSWDIEENDVP